MWVEVRLGSVWAVVYAVDIAFVKEVDTTFFLIVYAISILNNETIVTSMRSNTPSTSMSQAFPGATFTHLHS